MLGLFRSFLNICPTLGMHVSFQIPRNIWEFLKGFILQSTSVFPPRLFVVSVCFNWYFHRWQQLITSLKFFYKCPLGSCLCVSGEFWVRQNKNKLFTQVLKRATRHVKTNYHNSLWTRSTLLYLATGIYIRNADCGLQNCHWTGDHEMGPQ